MSRSLPAALRRRPVLAHELGASTNAKGMLVPPNEPSPLPPSELTADAIFWSTVNQWGLTCSTTQQVATLKQLFDDVGQSAMVLSARSEFRRGREMRSASGRYEPPHIPTAEDMKALAKEVEELDAMAMQASEQAARNRTKRRLRARTADPPPRSEASLELERQEAAATTIQRSSRRRRGAPERRHEQHEADMRQARPVRWSSSHPTAASKTIGSQQASTSQQGQQQHAKLKPSHEPQQDQPTPVASKVDGDGKAAKRRRVEAWALLERCERAAGTHPNSTLRVGGDSEGSWDTAGVGAHDPAELRQLLGALCHQHRALLLELEASPAPAPQGGAVIATTPVVAGISTRASIPQRATDAESAAANGVHLDGGDLDASLAASMRSAMAAEREEMATEILALVQVLRKGAQSLTQQRCVEAAEAGAARATKEAEKKAEVLATELEQDSLRAAAGGGEGGGGGGGNDASELVKQIGLASMLDFSQTSEEDKASNVRVEGKCAQSLAGNDNAAGIVAAIELASLPRITPPPPPTTQDAKPLRAIKPPTAAVARAAARAVDILEHLYELSQPPPPSAVVPLLSAVGRMASLEPSAAAAAVESGALPLLHNLLKANGDRPKSSAGVTLAACCALGEVIGSARHESQGVALQKALSAPDAPALPELVELLLIHAGLSSGGDATASATASAAAAATPSTAVAAAALASVLRYRPDGAARVSPDALAALIARIAQPATEDGGGLRIGDVDLVSALRSCGLDVSRLLRTTKGGLPRLVGMLDAPPPGATTAAAKAALQLDHLLRTEARVEGGGGGTKEEAGGVVSRFAMWGAAAAYGGLSATLSGAAAGGSTPRGASTGGRCSCAVARVRCPSRVALRALGGVDRLAVLLCGPDGRPPSTMRQAGPPRTLAAVAGCLELAVSGERSSQDAAAARGVIPALIKLIALSRAELRRNQKGAGMLETEPELLPNLLLATTALVRGAPQLAVQLRQAGGIEVLISLLEHRPAGGGVGEEHIFALDALHAAGENRPERSAKLLEAATLAGPPKKGNAGGGPGSAAEVAITVHTARAIGILARPLIAMEQEVA